MTSYFTDVDFISDHFTVFWREWLNIFLKFFLRYAVDSVILLFIKKKFQCFYTPFISRFLLWFEFQFVIILDGLE